MKKLLLTSVAALLLATGTAHAGRCDIWPETCKPKEFDCGRPPKYFLGGNLKEDSTTKDATLNFEINFSNNRERHLPSDELVIRYNFTTDKLWINGKQCKWSE